MRVSLAGGRLTAPARRAQQGNGRAGKEPAAKKPAKPVAPQAVEPASQPGFLGRALSAAAGLLPARQPAAAEESEEDTGGDADADAGAEDAQQTEREEAPGPAVKVEEPERTAVPRKRALKRMRLNNKSSNAITELDKQLSEWVRRRRPALP